MVTGFFFAFCFFNTIRLLKSLYLYKQWRIKSVNPTLKESKLEFRCLFVLGLGECVLQTLAIIAYFKNFFRGLDSKIDVSLIINLIYGLLEIISYLGKLAVIGMAYCYFKIYGGLEVTDGHEALF